jgi:hypothetical protein
VRDAIVDLKAVFDLDLVPNSFTDPKYFNLATMKSLLATI